MFYDSNFISVIVLNTCNGFQSNRFNTCKKVTLIVLTLVKISNFNRFNTCKKKVTLIVLTLVICHCLYLIVNILNTCNRFQSQYGVKLVNSAM